MFNLLDKFHINTQYTGWFFQQFLKMSFYQIAPSDIYMSFDADCFLIRDLVIDNIFFNVLDGNLPSNHPYIATNKILLELPNFHHMQFMSEFMIFQSPILKELIARMEQNKHNFFENILRIIGQDPLGLSFSEFECYANYCLAHQKGGYHLRQLPVLRIGGRFFESIDQVDNQVLKDFAKHYYMLQFNHWDKLSPYAKWIQNKTLRKILGVKNLLRIYHKTGQYKRDF
ncbi:DUF6492 family protein [Helicobacter sp. 12S02634-8]|uniref:DUF6492 family protein n=1 Tax=Helicobacter sp. 12S02634-8 TaxID=1476199 RepID=UPI0031BB5B1B